MIIAVRSTGVRVLVPRYGLESTINVCKEEEGTRAIDGVSQML
jgi:hypothetical protein